MSSQRIIARFRHTYPDFSLDVDLDLPGRGVTALFGHSGSGKTTLLRLIAGLQHTSEGYLSVNGEVWQEGARLLPTHRRALGYVFQEASLFDHLSARGNLEYGMRRVARGKAMDRAALDQAIALLGIGHLLKRRPHQLSGGERQRVAIARALALQPRLLLMDEPLAALDLARKQEILPYLERLHDELEIPVLYVSHSPDEVARLADTVVMLERGRVMAQGAVGELLTRLDLRLAREHDASAILDGQVRDHDPRYRLTRIDTPAGTLRLAQLDRAPGERVRLRIQARDLSLALDEPGTSSIVNILPARVLALEPLEEAQLLVKLGAGADQTTPLLAHITRYSADRLGLVEGQEVFAQIKAVALMD